MQKRKTPPVKRALSLVASVAMAVGTLAGMPNIVPPPLTASAADGRDANEVVVERRQLIIVGTKMTDSNKNDILGNGIFSYDADANQLNINGDFTYTWTDDPEDPDDWLPNYFIYCNYPNLTVNVAKDSVLTETKNKEENLHLGSINGMRFDGNTTITDSGKLTVESDSFTANVNDLGELVFTNNLENPIYIYGDARQLTISGLTADIHGNNFGISGSMDQALVIRNSTLNISNNIDDGFAACKFNDLVLDGCMITTPQNAFFNNEYGAVMVDYETAVPRVVIAPVRTITYKANGGSGADVVQSHGAGSAVTLKSASTFTRSGYVFNGWNTKADGSGNTYAAGKSVSWYDNVTLYAMWQKK